MSKGTALAPDPVAVRTFAERLNSHVAAAFTGYHDPGLMQLVAIHPASEATLTFPFKIGEVNYMVAEAIRQAESGHNVYIEARTVQSGVKRGKRGGIADTVGVFGLVNDADADKGKAGRLSVEPSFVIETSPGNAHHWILLDRPLGAQQAQELGAAIRSQGGADSASGVVTQPYRIPGTPNYPGRLKLARGRTTVPTSIVSLDGKVWSAAELQAAFPSKPKPQVECREREAGASGITSPRVEDVVSETGGDRSSRFYAAVAFAFKDGLTQDDLEALMRQYPEGCSGKYLEPYDRLAREIDRAWEKVATNTDAVQEAAATPAYADGSSPIKEARRAVQAGVQHFIATAEAYRLAGDPDAEPPVQALAVTTGVGKTRATARAVAAYVIGRRESGSPAKPIRYAVPTHRLGDEIEAQFAEQGVSARVFRGRQADDPSRPGETMCDDLEAVSIALSMGGGSSVTKMCCRAKLDDGTEARCQFYGTCSYQAQVTTQPEVWIVAHQLLFSAGTALGKVEFVIVDEGFWQTGIRIPKRGLTLDEIGSAVGSKGAAQDYLANDVEVYRAQLARALKRQGQPGGVRRADLVAEGLDVDRCTTAISAEWKLKDKVAIYPGMSRAERRIAARAAEQARHAQAFIGLWIAARGVLYDETIEVSGRLYIDTRDDEDGRVLVAKARSLKSIPKHWHCPTLILDATLPSLEILQAFYPQVQPAPAIEAAMPHARVRYVTDAPTSANKLKPDEDGTGNRNLRSVRREILRRFMELGRVPVLVIAQKAVAEWLRASGLPASISTEHFNNVAGLDQYRNVRGLIVVGRTLPAPAAVEALAGAITGRDIEKAEPWYPKPVRGLRTRDGSVAGMECETHPDPVADACRWQICEGELMQAIGRARGVNRTAADPLAIDIIANVVLPLTVDVAEPWNPAGEEIEMQIEGVVLDSPADMAAAWPGVWPNAEVAKKWRQRHEGDQIHTGTNPYKEDFYIGKCPRVRFRYQRPGARQKWRTGDFDPAVVPDPRAWLESRLGPLAAFHISETAQPDAAPASPPPLHADRLAADIKARLRARHQQAPATLRPAAEYAPELVARYRTVSVAPPEPFQPAPVKATVARFDPRAPIRFPPLIAGRLAMMKAAEAANRHTRAAETVER